MTYNLHPPPRIVEVDIRQDSNLIKSLLTRYTLHSTFPNIILRGKPLGGFDSLHAQHEQGTLRRLLEGAGLSVDAEGNPEQVVENKLLNDGRTRERPDRKNGDTIPRI